VDRAGSMLCLMVEYGIGHVELSVIAASGEWLFSGCEVTSIFFNI
jgi:hypothetical protein